MSKIMSRTLFRRLFILTALAILLVAGPTPSGATAVATDRAGAWVDSITISAIPSPQDTFNQMLAGDLHVHTQDIGALPGLWRQECTGAMLPT